MGIPESTSYDGGSAATMPEKDEQQWAMFLHLSALSIFIGIPGFVGPLVLWLIKKDQSPFIDEHGKEAVNFQISMFIWFALSALAWIVLVGFVASLVLLIVYTVCCIKAGLRANEGHHYQYPITIRFIK